jgi:hypothetical protein
MSMAEDDPFDIIMAGILFDVPEDVVSVEDFSDAELVESLAQINVDLIRSGELLQDKTTWGREQKSMRGAIQVEMHRRGLV